MLQHILDANYLLSTYGYIGIFLIIFVESGIFFFLPGDSLLFASGLIAGTGTLSLLVIMPLAVLAACLGSVAGYFIGTHVVRLKQVPGFRRLLSDRHVDAARAFFEKRGTAALVLARFIPAVRTATPWVAGMVAMDKKKFAFWSIIGAVGWVAIMTLAGYFLGKAFPGLEKYLTEAILAIIVISLVPAVLEWRRHRAGRAGE